MRKGIIVALATLAMGLTGLFASPAKGLQFGFNAGYSSVGFQLHGMGGELLFGFQGKDEHRPEGSVLRIGLAGASGEGETDLTKAKWGGVSFNNFIIGTAAQALGGLAGFAQLPAAQQQGAIAGALAGIEGGLTQAGISDLTKAKGVGNAFLLSAAYEYVLPQGVPGLGFIVGGELYVSQGSLVGESTDGGIGGGGVVGISYYTKNGLNFTFKTGLGVVDPGEVTVTNVKVEPEAKFYASPSFSIGFIH